MAALTISHVERAFAKGLIVNNRLVPKAPARPQRKPVTNQVENVEAPKPAPTAPPVARQPVPPLYARPALVLPPNASTNTVSEGEPVENKTVTNLVVKLPRTNRPPSVIELRYETTDPLLAFQQANAEKGFPESQYAMGIRYLNGTGVPRDEERAREYLEAAADRGNAKAKEKLRELRRLSSNEAGGSNR